MRVDLDYRQLGSTRLKISDGVEPLGFECIVTCIYFQPYLGAM